jgi:hypothetical protein
VTGGPSARRIVKRAAGGTRSPASSRSQPPLIERPLPTRMGRDEQVVLVDQRRPHRLGGEVGTADREVTHGSLPAAGPQGTRWSLCGAPWLQPSAIAGKSTGPGTRANKPNPLPPVATGCLRRSMVRRGSPVRVRKRALQKASKWPHCCADDVGSSFDLPENLSPGPVPSVELATDSRLEQTRSGAQSTSLVGRGRWSSRTASTWGNGVIKRLAATRSSSRKSWGQVAGTRSAAGLASQGNEDRVQSARSDDGRAHRPSRGASTKRCGRRP